jgi:hypothetical protein
MSEKCPVCEIIKRRLARLEAVVLPSTPFWRRLDYSGASLACMAGMFLIELRQKSAGEMNSWARLLEFFLAFLCFVTVLPTKPGHVKSEGIDHRKE